jgi:hypothetical protein
VGQVVLVAFVLVMVEFAAVAVPLILQILVAV